MTTVPDLITAECNAIREMLLAKNAAYGNSALDPVRVFSRASAEEQIRVRLDDKLSRLARGSGQETEDVEADIIGYLVLLRVHRRLSDRARPPSGCESDAVQVGNATYFVRRERGADPALGAKCVGCGHVYIARIGGCPQCGEGAWKPWPEAE